MSTTDDEIKSFYADIGVDTSIIDNAAGVTESPLKPVTDLRKDVSSAFDIVAVVNNKDTVRVGWEGLTSTFTGSTQDIPLEPGSSTTFPYITFAADDTGLYVSDGNNWGKVPSYQANWEDLTDTTRFLLVDKTMSLSESELSNVWETLHLGVADDSTLGLVKSSDTVSVDENGVMNVAEATISTPDNIGSAVPGIVYVKGYYDNSTSGNYVVTEEYVRGAIESIGSNIPIASTTQLGGIQLDPSVTAVSIDARGLFTIHNATDTQSGVVLLATEKNNLDSKHDHAASVGLVQDIITEHTADVTSRIAGENLGMVRVPGGTSIIVGVDGTIDVKPATESTLGTVQVYQSLDDSSNTEGAAAVTPNAVTNYVKTKLSSLSTVLPPATPVKLGAVKIGEGLTVDGSGLIEVANATSGSLGGVYTVAASKNDTTPHLVPSIAKVNEMIGSSNSTIRRATTAALGSVKLGTSNIIIDGAPVGFNDQGQLYVSISGDSDIFDTATSTTAGTVMLSSNNVSLNGAAITNHGLPIGRDATGRIYVDANNVYSKASTTRYGLVQLSIASDTVLSEDNPGIGVDKNGRIRVATSTGSYNFSDYNDEIASVEYVNLGYYTYNGTNYPIALAATSSSLGVVRLGTDTEISGGIPVGVDDAGRLHASISISGESLSEATVDSYGTVKLSTASTITSGLPIGLNADGQLYVASTSTGLTMATTALLGGVRLSSGTTYAADYTYAVPIGLNTNNQIVADLGNTTLPTASYTEKGIAKLGHYNVDTTDSLVGENSAGVGITADERLAVPAATSTALGTVKVGGVTYEEGMYSLVGLSPSGQLAVGGSGGGGGGTPFFVTLYPSGTEGSYLVTMTGGTVQMNDGTIVNVQPITNTDNMIITPSAGQVLRLAVYMTSAGEPVAKVLLTSDSNVLTCKPSLG